MQDVRVVMKGGVERVAAAVDETRVLLQRVVHNVVLYVRARGAR
jgi:hypothetical protein